MARKTFPLVSPDLFLSDDIATHLKWPLADVHSLSRASLRELVTDPALKARITACMAFLCR
jgi:hypothetical protein